MTRKSQAPSPSKFLIVNGWTLLAHPLFLDQISKLRSGIAEDKRQFGRDYTNKNNAKLLKLITDQAFKKIPTNPMDPIYRQGKTLGDGNTNWFRAKFANGRFRLFFRFDSTSKTIIYAWVNDEETLRSYGSKTDAYAVFKGMLANGHPPDSWRELLLQCGDGSALANIGP